MVRRFSRCVLSWVRMLRSCIRVIVNRLVSGVMSVVRLIMRLKRLGRMVRFMLRLTIMRSRVDRLVIRLVRHSVLSLKVIMRWVGCPLSGTLHRLTLNRIRRRVIVTTCLVLSSMVALRTLNLNLRRRMVKLRMLRLVTWLIMRNRRLAT